MNPEGQIKPFPAQCLAMGVGASLGALLFFLMLPFWIYAAVLFVRLDMEPEISEIPGRCSTTGPYPAPVSVLQKNVHEDFFFPGGDSLSFCCFSCFWRRS